MMPPVGIKPTNGNETRYVVALVLSLPTHRQLVGKRCSWEQKNPFYCYAPLCLVRTLRQSPVDIIMIGNNMPDLPPSLDHVVQLLLSTSFIPKRP